MMVNALQFSLDKFIVGGVGNGIAHDGRRIMDILNRCSFPQQLNESRSVRFFHTYPTSILWQLVLEIRHLAAARLQKRKYAGPGLSPLATAFRP